MVKTLLLGLLAVTICGFVYAAPAADPHTKSELPQHPEPTAPEPEPAAPPLEDPAARSERSTNLSHVTGTARKIQMFIKNRHLQILPDGTVNGTTDDTSAFTILQRTTIGIGQMKIQGVATCQYLCMDSCGLLYGSRDFGDECVFNETIEQTNYNTYSSTKYSNEKRTFYLALNRRGQPRKVVVRARNQLGRLSSYTRVLTRNVAPELQLHPMRHHGHVCPSPVSHQSQKAHLESPRCRKKKKRKKKKRKCPDDELDHDLCQKRQSVANKHKVQNRNSHKCDNEKDSDLCQRDVNNKKKLRLDVSDKHLVSVPKKKKKNRKGVRKRLEERTLSQETTTTTLAPTSTTPPEDLAPDEDYGVDSSTHSDWEDSTALPDVSMAVADAKLAAPHIDSD
ncbi:uncharacterized protein LOC108910994 [Anoplophora glabripennis]|uniref:uncharacterized protein LOC108910994 n=1 Tax=Anoplophora glabripennis TaxID=217634 RepID=UPI0008737C7B|nr:uncharacterized protein LOC108910994 [Anoplophora glabripennis]